MRRLLAFLRAPAHPVRALVAVLIITAVVEIGVMALIDAATGWRMGHGVREWLLDAALLAVIAAPLLWYLVIGPIRASANVARGRARDVRRRSRVLAEDRERLSAAVAAANDVVFLTDTTGLITFVNPAFTELYGYTAADVVGRETPRILKSGLLSPEYYQHLWARLAAGQPVSAEHINRTKDGRLIVVEASASPVRDGAGHVRGFVAIQRDISDRKQMEQALRESEEQLRQAQKMDAVGRLTAGVAHDFNNVLTVVSGYTEFLLQDKTLTAEQRLEVDEIAKAAGMAVALSRKLLMLSRPGETVPVLLDLNEVIAGMESLLRRTMSAEIELVLRLGDGLSPIHADRAHIEQVILNLVVNARDAMGAGGTLTIETGNVMLAGRPRVRLGISDTGHGISPDVRARLFEPFFTTKAAGKGTGLGLSTVMNIVKDNQGHIDVASEPGRGATFAIYLPPADTA